MSAILNHRDLPDDAKSVIRSRMDQLVSALSGELNACSEAIGTELFYRTQRHPTYGRNASVAQKNASYSHWQGLCQKCGKPVARNPAKFHHLKRGVSGQHGPENLVPQHTHCHDHEHGAVKGSLSKGSPERKAEPEN